MKRHKNDASHTYTEEVAKLGHNYSSVVTAPTCEADGYTTHTCLRCSDSYTDSKTDKLGHNYEGVVTTAPTCTEKGVKIFTCKNDTTHTYTEEIAKLGHNYSSVVTAPTCEADGYTTHVCSRCSDSYTDSKTDKLGHDYEGVVTTAPTCTAKGEKTYTCKNDASHKYTEDIAATGHTAGAEATCTTAQKCTVCQAELQAALGHNYASSFTVDVYGTCTTDGSKSKHCSRCDAKTDVTTIEARGHNLVDNGVKTPETCTTDGVMNQKCYRALGNGDYETCTYTTTRVIPATGHTEVKDAAVEPTCTATGKTEGKHCSTCNTVLTAQQTVAALGHSYSSVVTAPTCETKGYTTYTCSRCSDSYKGNEVAATGHNYTSAVTTAATCTTKGVRTYTCQNDASHKYTEDIPATGHTAGAAATCTTAQKCTVCQAELQAALGHDYGSATYNFAADGKSCTATRVCGRDSAHKETANATITSAVKTAATCMTKGTTTYTAKFSVTWAATQTKDVQDIAVLNHGPVDANNDKLCDTCNGVVIASFDILEYPDEAIVEKSTKAELEEYVSRADKAEDTEEALYASTKGHDDNGIIASPYFDVKVDGTDIPVYGTVVYVAEDSGHGHGGLHSFSEIYVRPDSKTNLVNVSLTSIWNELNITSAQILSSPGYENATLKVENGEVTATLSGPVSTGSADDATGAVYTFVFNGFDKDYVYTFAIRPYYDDDATIALLRSYGYNVIVVEGYVENYNYLSFSGGEGNGYHINASQQVLYLKRGAYITMKHNYEINSNADNAGNAEAGAVNNNGIGLNRYPFINSNGNGAIYIYGFGAFDMTHLDRGERRGFVFAYGTDIQMIGPKLINPCEWGIVTYRCNSVLMSNVDVYGYRQNSDAFDICNSQNVTVQDCVVRSGDDGIVIKTLGGDENAIVDNVTVQNCYAWASKARAFGIFGEVNKNISNVTFKNSTVLCHDATWDETLIPAIGIIAVSSDNPNVVGNISNVTFDNIEICRNEASPVNCISSLQNTMHDLTFNNIKFASNNKDKGYPIRFEWFNNGNIYNVSFTDVYCGDTKITCTRDGKRTGNWADYLKDAVSCWIMFEKNS